MSTEQIREQLIQSIEQMPAAKLKLARHLLKDFIDENESDVTWKNLSPELKKRINESIKQASNGEGKDGFEVINDIRIKLGLDA